MSMSTPLNTLPLKTQQTEDASDINDPMVQDVLNEFQEELLMSNKKNDQMQQVQHVPQMPQMSQHMQMPQMSQQMQNGQQMPQQVNHVPQIPKQVSQQAPYGQKYTINYNQNSFPYQYLNIDVAKQTLIIVILAILIFHTSLMEMIYEKMPIYIQDIIQNFDVYVRGIVLFIVLYTLTILEYI